MWTTLKRALQRFRPEGSEKTLTPSRQHAEFLLQYDALRVGRLLLEDEVWVFRYSDEFRRQSEVMPLIDFPDPCKVYQSADLWPFFTHRIPSLAQPQVKRTIEVEGLDEKNKVELLARFGRKTISNPFVLEPLEA